MPLQWILQSDAGAIKYYFVLSHPAPQARVSCDDSSSRKILNEPWPLCYLALVVSITLKARCRVNIALLLVIGLLYDGGVAIAVQYAGPVSPHIKDYTHTYTAPTRRTVVVEALPLSSEYAKRLLTRLILNDCTTQARKSCPSRLTFYTYPLGQAHIAPFHFRPAMMKADSYSGAPLLSLCRPRAHP